MTVDFRCEKCGAMIHAQAEPGTTVRCTCCAKKVAVPAILASLPHPQVPRQAGASAPDVQRPQRPEAPDHYAEDHLSATGALAQAVPWVISILFHAGLGLVLMLVAMFVVARRVPEPVPVPGTALPDTSMRPMSWGGEVPDHQRGDPLQPIKAPPEDPGRDTGISDKRDASKPVELIGAARRRASGGELRPWGERIGGPKLFPTERDPDIGNIHHVVYVIDRSGSMVESFDAVQMEMLRSIGRLQPEQDFHVILFAKGRPQELPSRRLLSAITPNKVAAADFLSAVQARDMTDPVPALERAFAVLRHADSRRPGKLIFLLTDGNFPNNSAVLATVRALNKDKSVKINTYLYGSRPPEAERMMREIADQSGGIHRYVPALD